MATSYFKKAISRTSTIILKAFFRKTIIIRIDGGICSQMHFYLIGQYFASRGNNILYDINWYKTDGLDSKKQQVRNFDLLRLHKFIDLKTIDNNYVLDLFKSKFYSRYDYRKDVNCECNWKHEKAPFYMGDYYRDFKELYTVYFPKYFTLNKVISCLDIENQSILNTIQKQEVSIAVHIRRGDLSEYSSSYGNPCTFNYFVKAIKLMNSNGATHFFFFSDEPQWIKDNIGLILHNQENFSVIDINGSDKGYMDLVLIGACTHVITSKGTLGKYGALLTDFTNKIVILNNEETEKIWRSVFPKSISISN